MNAPSPRYFAWRDGAASTDPVALVKAVAEALDQKVLGQNPERKRGRAAYIAA
jgi:hypothetical protein